MVDKVISTIFIFLLVICFGVLAIGGLPLTPSGWSLLNIFAFVLNIISVLFFCSAVLIVVVTWLWEVKNVD